MGAIFALFQMVGSFLLIPLGFAIGVYVPLIITNVGFQVYSTLGMSNFARELFGSTNGVGVNWNNGFSQFLLWALIIGAISFVVCILCRAVANWTNKGIKQATSLARISYGMASIVLVPIVFMFSTTITALLFNIMSGNSSASMISASENSTFATIMQAYGGKIHDILGSSWKINGEAVAWGQSLIDLTEQLNTLNAQANGYADVQTKISKILQELATLQQQNDEWFLNQFNHLVEISRTLPIGQRLSDLQPLQEVYDAFYDAQNNFGSLITDLNSIEGYKDIITTADAQSAFVYIFGDGNYNHGWLGAITFGGENPGILSNYEFTPYNVFVDQNITQTGKTQIYISAISQVFEGCSESGKPIASGYWTVSTTSGLPYNSQWIGIDSYYQRANPNPTFTLAGMINSWVLGGSGVNSNFSVWNLYFSAYDSFFTGHMERVVVGMMVANMMMAGMMAYAWYMVGRILELIILWLGSIIVGFKDDGEGTQFKIIMRAVAIKTLSILFIELVFTLTNTLINIGFMQALMDNAAVKQTKWFNVSNSAVIFATVLLFVGSYYMGNTLCTMILGEAGQLRSFGDQYANVSGTGRQQYGHGTKSVANQGSQQVGRLGTNARKGISDYSLYRAANGKDGLLSKDFGNWRKTGGKAIAEWKGPKGDKK